MPPHNLALLRRWALNACKLEGSKDSMKGQLKRAGWHHSYPAAHVSPSKSNAIALAGWLDYFRADTESREEFR
jgi:hypothetical protein